MKSPECLNFEIHKKKSQNHCTNTFNKRSFNNYSKIQILLGISCPLNRKCFLAAPRGDIILVMDHLNVKDAVTCHGQPSIGIRNDNGERFVDFCNANYLVIGGTAFQHKPCHKIS